MTIEWLRDLVISILGILSIIVIIGILVGLFIVYLKTRKIVRAINNSVCWIHKWLTFIKNCANGLNESVKIFK